MTLREGLRRRGVSLIEVLVTLGLFLMFLVAAGGLVIKASRVLRFSEAKSNSLRALTFALDRMAMDAAGAQFLNTPNTGSDSSLVVTVVDPSNMSRLYPSTITSFPMLELNISPYLLQVAYTIEGDRLLRQVSRDGTVLGVSRVGERIHSLQCTRATGDLLEIRLSTQEERGPRTVSTAVPLLVGVP